MFDNGFVDNLFAEYAVMYLVNRPTRLIMYHAIISFQEILPRWFRGAVKSKKGKVHRC